MEEKRVTDFAGRLKELMELYNYKQVDILNKTLPEQKNLNVTLSKSQLSHYVNGKVEPSADRIYLIAKSFNVDEAWLLGFNVPMTKDDTSKQLLSEPIASNLTKVSIVNVPILGTIACGEPILADENIEDYYPMVAELLPKGNTFLLRAYGDSMYPKIEDGDLVLIREQPTVENGEIACVLVNGDTEATLKRVKYQGDMIMLVPDNKNYDPIVVTPEMEVRIVGKAINIISVA